MTHHADLVVDRATARGARGGYGRLGRDADLSFPESLSEGGDGDGWHAIGKEGFERCGSDACDDRYHQDRERECAHGRWGGERGRWEEDGGNR